MGFPNPQPCRLGSSGQCKNRHETYLVLRRPNLLLPLVFVRPREADLLKNFLPLPPCTKRHHVQGLPSWTGTCQWASLCLSASFQWEALIICERDAACLHHNVMLFTCAHTSLYKFVQRAAGLTWAFGLHTSLCGSLRSWQAVFRPCAGQTPGRKQAAHAMVPLKQSW